MGQLMWYTTKVVPEVENEVRELAVHMIHPGTEHWKALGCLIIYLKGKKVKVIIIRKPKVLKAVMFCDSNHSIEKETIKSVSGLVATLGWTLITCFSKTHTTVTMSITEAEYVVLSACTQELKFVTRFLEKMTEVQKNFVAYEDNQGAIFLAKNRQVGISTKHIDIRHHFLRDMVEDKDIDIQYIWSENNPAYIMTKNTPEVDFEMHVKRTTDGELWELLNTGRNNVKNNRVTL